MYGFPSCGERSHSPAGERADASPAVRWNALLDVGFVGNSGAPPFEEKVVDADVQAARHLGCFRDEDLRVARTPATLLGLLRIPRRDECVAFAQICERLASHGTKMFPVMDEFMYENRPDLRLVFQNSRKYADRRRPITVRGL